MADIAKQPTPLPPCRLYVILARDAPVGVIFRRGPSKRVQILHWNTDTDTFTPGQWFHGRIYERQARLSADGTLLMYDAMKTNRRTLNDKDYGHIWTAISKPPYLTAITLWAHSTSVGSLRSADAEWLDHWNHAENPQSGPLPQAVTTDRNDVVSMMAGLNPHLERGGWKQTQEWQGELVQSAFGKAYQDRKQSGQPADFDWMRSVDGLDTVSHYVTHAPGIHEKPHPDHNVTLVMTTILSGFQPQYRYSVRQSGEVIHFNSVEWADWDRRGRIVFAQNGRIFAQDADAIGCGAPVELVSLNENTPKPMVAPDWAKVW